MVETLKDLLGVYTNTYDFVFVIFALILVIFVFNSLLGLFSYLFKWVGGCR